VICVLCEQAETRPYTFSDTFGGWDGAPSFVVDGLEGDECTECGAVTISPEQCRQNRDKIAAARAGGA
jgi:hypothetical protein